MKIYSISEQEVLASTARATVSIGAKVLVRVPFGPNAGQVVGQGRVTDSVFSRVDGDAFEVQYASGQRGWHAANWIVLA